MAFIVMRIIKVLMKVMIIITSAVITMVMIMRMMSVGVSQL